MPFSHAIVDAAANSWTTAFTVLLALLAQTDLNTLLPVRLLVGLGPGVVVDVHLLRRGILESVLARCTHPHHAQHKDADGMATAAPLLATFLHAYEAWTRFRDVDELDDSAAQGLWLALVEPQAIGIDNSVIRLHSPPFRVEHEVGRSPTLSVATDRITTLLSQHWNGSGGGGGDAMELESASRYALHCMVRKVESPPFVEFENVALRAFWSAHQAALSWRFPLVDWTPRPEKLPSPRPLHMKDFTHHAQQASDSLRASVAARLSDARRDIGQQ
jgi:hypothetical protein